VDVAMLLNPISPGAKFSVKEPYLPALQTAQTGAFAPEYVPAAQMGQTDALAPEYVPAGQARQALAEDAPAAAEYVPAAQFRQTDAFAPEYAPAAQFKHALLSSLECVPAGQMAQTDAFAPEYAPAAQFKHALRASLEYVPRRRRGRRWLKTLPPSPGTCPQHSQCTSTLRGRCKPAPRVMNHRRIIDCRGSGTDVYRNGWVPGIGCRSSRSGCTMVPSLCTAMDLLLKNHADIRWMQG
jgi:hypothetical protein